MLDYAASHSVRRYLQQAPFEKGRSQAVTDTESTTGWPPKKTDQDLAQIRDKVDQILWDERTPDLLRAYFDAEDGYAGRWWDPQEPSVHKPDEIGCHDLLALTFLDVYVPGQAAGRLLFDRQTRRSVTDLLRDVPTGVPLWEVDREGYEAANALWDFFIGKRWGTGQTITSKLLARKRPELIPITDSVLRCGIRRPDGTDFSSGYFHVLGDAGSRRYVTQLETLKAASGCSPLVTALRVLDVAIWMTFSRQAAGTRAVISTEPWCQPDRIPPGR